MLTCYLHDLSIYEKLPESAPESIDESRYPEGYIATGFSTPDRYVVELETSPGIHDTSRKAAPHYA